MQESPYENNMMNFNQFPSNPLDQNQAIKRLPNPQNYKIVKCKNFETGKIKI